MPALITVVIPSLNHARYIEAALRSLQGQSVPLEVFVMDGGSTDGTIEILERWSGWLGGWRSERDSGQSSAINEGISRGTAPYVCWLNSDDWFLPNAMVDLVNCLGDDLGSPVAYGRAWNVNEDNGKRKEVWVERFNERRLATRCFISQPATLIRRRVWEEIGGLDSSLSMAMDYDLWWRIFKKFGPFRFVDKILAVNRDHKETKTRKFRHLHYMEAIKVVRRHYGYAPIKWWLAQPYSVWLKALWR
jgi:glycosyltransferase involved in cell wall biosynthesis